MGIALLTKAVFILNLKKKNKEKTNSSLHFPLQPNSTRLMTLGKTKKYASFSHFSGIRPVAGLIYHDPI